MGSIEDTAVTTPVYSCPSGKAELFPGPHWHDPLTKGEKNTAMAPSLRDIQVWNTDGIATV